MSNTYGMVLARALDICACSFVWRDYDVTISSMCGLELRTPAPARWARILGWCLNHIQANHCEIAIAADKQRCEDALKLLGA